MQRPLLFSWGAKALFVGSSLQLSPHRNAVAVLAVSLDGPFVLSNDAGKTRCRSALIEPNTLHHLCCGKARMAFLYIDALSRELGTLRALCNVAGPTASVGMRGERALVSRLRSLAEREVDFAMTRAYLDARLLAAPSLSAADPVSAALRYLREHASERPSLAELAQRARLSPSRFRHRFVELTGVPFRRYRTWISIGAAIRKIARGATLTHAAIEAGFASSAHFSTTFRAMFGLAPSQLRQVVLAAEAD